MAFHYDSGPSSAVLTRRRFQRYFVSHRSLMDKFSIVVCFCSTWAFCNYWALQLALCAPQPDKPELYPSIKEDEWLRGFPCATDVRPDGHRMQLMAMIGHPKGDFIWLLRNYWWLMLYIPVRHMFVEFGSMQLVAIGLFLVTCWQPKWWREWGRSYCFTAFRLLYTTIHLGNIYWGGDSLISQFPPHKYMIGTMLRSLLFAVPFPLQLAVSLVETVLLYGVLSLGRGKDMDFNNVCYHIFPMLLLLVCLSVGLSFYETHMVSCALARESRASTTANPSMQMQQVPSSFLEAALTFPSSHVAAGPEAHEQGWDQVQAQPQAVQSQQPAAQSPSLTSGAAHHQRQRARLLVHGMLRVLCSLEGWVIIAHIVLVLWQVYRSWNAAEDELDATYDGLCL